MTEGFKFSFSSQRTSVGSTQSNPDHHESRNSYRGEFSFGRHPYDHQQQAETSSNVWDAAVANLNGPLMVPQWGSRNNPSQERISGNHGTIAHNSSVGGMETRRNRHSLHEVHRCSRQIFSQNNRRVVSPQISRVDGIDIFDFQSRSNNTLLRIHSEHVIRNSSNPSMRDTNQPNHPRQVHRTVLEVHDDFLMSYPLEHDGAVLDSIPVMHQPRNTRVGTNQRNHPRQVHHPGVINNSPMSSRGHAPTYHHEPFNHQQVNNLLHMNWPNHPPQVHQEDAMSYEQLLALEELMGAVKSGLSEETILSNLKTRRIHVPSGTSSHLNESRDVKEETELCIICQAEYENQEKIATLDCGHEYHIDCIKQWLLEKNVCPVCKRPALNGYERQEWNQWND